MSYIIPRITLRVAPINSHTCYPRPDINKTQEIDSK